MPLILPRPPWPIVNETATDAPTRQLTVAAENTPIPILYGEDQLGARLLAVKVDEPNNRVVMSLGWCLGEIAGIDQIYFDGTPAPAGVTFTHYLGTPSQGIDPTLQGAIAGYSDTNVLTVGGVNVGTAYTVAVISKGVKVPRNITADIRGLKLYDPRQNRIRQSETYSNAAWGKTRVTVSSPGGTAPTGSAITKLAETTGSGTHLISITESASASTAYRASVWIQAAGRDKGRFTLDGESIDFDLTAVTAGAGHIVAEGSGWYRIDLKATTGGAASTISYQLNIFNNAGSDSYTGDGSSGFNLGGSLIVQSAESYPYVKTTTAHITPATAYSTNPALVLANFYASTVYGKGQTPNYGSAAKCAVANDESVGGSARRSIGLAIERIARVEQWVETIRTYAACFIDPSGDKPTFIPDRPAPTRRALTESDIVESTFRPTRRSGRNVPTVVTVIYTDRTVTPYRDGESDPAKVSGVDAGTVQRREITLRLPGIGNHEQAYREAVEQLNALRLIAEDIEFETYDDAIVDQIGDIIALNIANPIPISGDLYRIMAAEPVHGSGSAWRISAAAHTDLIYSDSVQAGSHVNDTVMPDASSIDGPTSLNATSSTEINIDGTPITALNVTWTAATSIYVDRYQIEYKRSEDIDWQRAETQNTNYQIKPVIPAISYDIRVRTASQLIGIYSAWVSLTISATGKGDIPAAPTNLSTLDTFYGIVLTWTNPAINDLAHIEIWRSADNNRANAVHINDVIGTSYTDGNVGGTAYYWIRAVNTSEIASDWHPTSSTGGVSGTKTNLDSAAADTTAPTDPGSLSLTTGVEEANLTVIAWVKGTWTASTDDGILSGYQVQWWTSEDATKISTFAPVGTTEYRIVPVKPGLTVFMRVRAEDWAGNVSNWTATETIVAASYGTPPANVTGATLTAGLDKLVARWTNPADESWLETEVYLGTTSGFTPGTGNLKGTVRTDELVIADGLTNGTNYYAKFRTRGKGGESGFSAAVGPAAPFKITDLNIANYFETAAILNAYIANLDAAKITTGLLSADRIGANTIVAGKLNVSQLSAIAANLGTVTAGILQGAIVRTAASGARVQLNSTNGVEVFNSGGTRTVHLNKDGSGYVGSAGALSWNTTGTVTIPGSLIAGEIVGNTIKTAVSGWRVTLNESGIPIRYWDGTNTHFSVDTSGNVDAKQITIRDANGTILLQSGGNLDWGRVAGSGKPVDNATKNVLYRQTTAPAGTSGDIWFDTDDNLLYRHSGSAWEVIGNGYDNTSQLSDGAGLGQTAIWTSVTGSGKPVDNATKNTIYRQTGAPAGTNGDIWFDTDDVILYRHNGSAWERVGNDFADTAQLADGAGLGTKALWSGVTGTGKPADNATRNTLTVSSTAPGSPVNGDLWYDNSNAQWKVRSGGTWTIASDITAQKTAAAIASQGAFATLNQITSSNVSTYIANAAILNAQIGNVIQASALAGDGQPTWKLDKTGAIDARSITIRDTNGTVILQSGGNLDYARVGGTKPPSNADVTGDIIDKSGGSLLPNWDLNVVDSTGKPAGIRATQGLADRGGVAVHGSNSSAITLSHPSIDFFAYGFPAIPIDDKSEYLVTIKHSSSASTADGLYLRFEELNTPLPLGMTHIGSGTKDSAATDRTSLIDIVSNGPMPGSAGWVEATYTYKPTAGVKYASFAMYKWGTGTGHNYSVHAVQIRPTLQQITSSNITTFIASAAIGNAQIGNAAIGNAQIGNAAVDTLQIAGQAVTIPVSAYTEAITTITASEDSWHEAQQVSITSTGAPIIVLAGGFYYKTGSGTSNVNVRILRDATQIYVASGSQFLSLNANLMDTPGAGAHTYYIQWRLNLTANVDKAASNRALVLLEAKR